MKSNRINILFFCSLFVGVLQLAVSLWSINQWIVNNQRADTAFGTLHKLDQLQLEMRNVRRIERLYRESGKQKILADYNDSKEHVKNTLLLINKLIVKNSRLEIYAKNIERAVVNRINEYDLAIEMPNDAKYINPAAPRKESEKFSTIINSIKTEISGLQAQASKDQQKGIAIVRYLIVSNSIIMFCLVISVYILLRKDLAHRISEETVLVRQREELEAQVHQRTKDLIVANEQLRCEALERVRNQYLLNEKNMQLNCIMEAMTDGFVAMDNEWRYTYINSAAARYFNRQPSELLGKICWEEFPASNQSTSYGEIMRSKEENHFVDFEAAAGDTSVRWYENRCYPSPDGMTIYFTEITERKNLEQARYNLAEYEEKIQEQERLALSREVHDEIGQDLTALKLDLNWIERRLPPESRELAERIMEMRENLGQLINVARKITSRLRPPLLDNLGLVAALEWQTNDFKKRSGLKCHYKSNVEVATNDEHISSSLLRILKESLSNVLRHAKATEVGVSLYQNEDRIVIEITDNGDGVTDDRVNSNTSFGIMGMRERAQLCGGSLSVTGKTGEGTKVFCTIPLPGKGNA